MVKYVCCSCLKEPHIRNFIESNAVPEECSYCEDPNSETPVAYFSKVAEFILTKIQTEYEDANNCLPWESAEGGWQGTTFDTLELLTDTIGLDICSQELLDDLVDVFSEIVWCEKDPFDLTVEQDLRFQWKQFSHQVRHEVRHVFFRLSGVNPHTTETGIPELERGSLPYEVLYRVGQLVNQLALVQTIDTEQTFFRVRLHEEKTYSTVQDLGPPPKELARYSNRFSPAGIPMFYGAIDERTAIAETYDYKQSPSKVATIGVFKNLVPLRILDLTNLPPLPSIFDDLPVLGRDSVRFLHHFVGTCTLRIEKDGREHIDYVPTQVVTEYFRHIFTTSDGNHIHGILYRSAMETDGVCCVLFVTGDDCTEDRSDLQDFFGVRQATLSLITAETSSLNLP